MATDIVEPADGSRLIAQDDQGGAANLNRFHVARFGQFRLGTGKNPGAPKTVFLLQRQPVIGPIGRIGQAAGVFDRGKRLRKPLFADERHDLGPDIAPAHEGTVCGRRRCV